MDILNKITCSVSLDHTRGWHLVSEERFYSQLTKEATAQLQEMGLNVEASVPGRIQGLGAGGSALIGTIYELIKLKPIATLIVAGIGLVSRTYIKALGRRHRISKQAILVSLHLEHAEKVKDDSLGLLPYKAAVAFDAGTIVQQRLAKKYPLFDVSLDVSTRLPKNGVNAIYHVDSAEHLKLKTYRMARIIRAASFQNGDNLYVRFSKYGTIQHVFHQLVNIEDSPYSSDDWRSAKGRTRTYYTYVSSRMFKGYKRRPIEMKWSDFQKAMGIAQ